MEERGQREDNKAKENRQTGRQDWEKANQQKKRVTRDGGMENDRDQERERNQNTEKKGDRKKQH